MDKIDKEIKEVQQLINKLEVDINMKNNEILLYFSDLMEIEIQSFRAIDIMFRMSSHKREYIEALEKTKYLFPEGEPQGFIKEGIQATAGDLVIYRQNNTIIELLLTMIGLIKTIKEIKEDHNIQDLIKNIEKLNLKEPVKKAKPNVGFHVWKPRK